ncbi:MAG TPA: O-antigen ligase family protein [Pyrinomonadaceae bacterium]
MADASASATGDATVGAFARGLERLVVACLFAFAVCAPHSIAAAEGVWVLGLLAWAARFAVRPRPVLRRTPVDYALLGFFVLTVFSSVFSYEPDVSIGKLRAASLFTIVYLAAQNVPSRRVLRALVVTLVASCTVNVAYTFAVYAVGRGVKIGALSPAGALYAAGAREGDTLLAVDGAPVRNPSDLERGLAAARAGREVTARWPDGKPACWADERVACVGGVRAEVPLALGVERGKFFAGATPEARLGVERWSRGHEDRAHGFYGHYTTYAEVLQLIGSLAAGLLVALAVARRGGATRDGERARRGDESSRQKNVGLKNGRAILPLAVALAGIACALLLTVTRASWLAFLVSIFLIVLAGAAGRRAVALLLLAACVAAPVGLYVLRAKRGVGFIDQRDQSTTWRETVWREAFGVLTRSPRHLAVGVGMDTLKRRWREWGMFDGGRLPWGHLHSTPLQIAFERGLPALAAWLALLGLYWRMLWRLARRGGGGDWRERGLALGALGGAVGFFVSGLVHYNFGDSEVVMVFYFITGLALALERLTASEPTEGTTA